MKRFIFFILLSSIFAFPLYAETGIGLYVNQASVALELSNDIDTSYTIASLKGEGIYKNDHYKMLSGIIGVKNREMMPGINYLIGFKAFYLDAENLKIKEKSIATGLAFLLDLNYEIDSRINPLPLPISLNCQFSGSPKPLTWNDGEYYWEIRGGLGFHILNNATIKVDLRRISAEFEENSFKWTKDDYNVLLGYEIRF